MCVDCIARNVVDQIGLEDYRLAADVDREEAEPRGQDLVELLGVLLHIEDCNSRTFRSLVRVIFGQKERSGDRSASRQSCAANKKVSTGKAHSVTPNACNARG